MSPEDAAAIHQLHDPEPWFQPGDQVQLPNGHDGEVQHEVSGFVEVLDRETGTHVTIGREVLKAADPPTFDRDAHPAEEQQQFREGDLVDVVRRWAT